MVLKTLSFIIIFFLGSAITSSEWREPITKESTVFLASESYLKIKGKTNVSKFECHFDMNTISEAISIKYKDHDETIKFDDTQLILPNVEFNCGGKIINKDFNNLLNTDQFPEIILKLKEISKSQLADDLVTATVEINISNVIKTYTIPISITSNQGLHASGRMPLDINDFNLTAPTKMLGMVKVLPEIEIQFSLKILGFN
ncbi:YceI family protein [Winogradskyella ludwigii]|uniref:YceI family protein n=1 Tax=Winogradskyella ludwigii TaxID=2686076 RepID=UPI0015C81072|nr:YceI family protein [Winogradskyella ludwigii]